MVRLHVLALAALCQLAWAAERGSPSPSPSPARSGSGKGSLNEAPAWLEQHEREAARERGRESSALYFPMTHRSKIDPTFQSHKPRGRLLASNASAPAEVSWELSRLTNPLSYFTTISLGSAGQQFNVLVDTGSSLLWVQCDCIQCDEDPSSTLPMNPSYSTASSSTENAVLCNDEICNTLSSFFYNSYGCNVPTPNTTVDFSPTDKYCKYVVKYLDTSFTWGNVYVDALAVTFSNNTFWQPNVVFGCGRVQSNNISPGTYGYDGLMGLAMGPDSILNYLKEIGQSFSVCLEGVGTDGHLVLGRTTLPAGAVYSPVKAGTNVMYFWQLVLSSYSVGSDGPYIPPSNPFVLDTGSSFSLISRNMYATIYSTALGVTESQALQNDYFPYPGHLTAQDLANNFPTLTLQFPSAAVPGETVSMEIPAFNYLFTVLVTDSNQKKITFIYPAAIYFTSGNTNIIGGSWLQNFEILHEIIDEAALDARMGWYPLNCTTGKVLYPNGTNGDVVVKYPTTTSGVRPPAPPRPPPAAPASAAQNSIEITLLLLSILFGLLGV